MISPSWTHPLSSLLNMESTKKTRPNNRAKSNCFFHCFRPNDVMDYHHFPTKSFQPPKTTDPLLKYIAVAEKEAIAFPTTILSSALTAAKGGGEGGGSCRRKKTIIRQALKATLNETLWGKKIINFRRKTKKDSMSRSSESNLEGESDKIPNKECKITYQTNSNTSSSSQCSAALTQSSLSSSTTTSSSSSPETQARSSSSELCPQPRSLLINNGIGVTKQKEDVGDSRKGYYGSNMHVCLPLIISLVALILWGKFCAILCTSIGFFVVPPRRRKPCHEGTLFGNNEFDSVQYKKKIIMEGLLERRR